MPRVYEQAGSAHLLDEVCRDVEGRPSECGWYYWERKPVYAACIYSDAFRRYLLDRCKHGVDLGMDVVNLDEVMTSVGLMNREARGTGFCARCLERFRSHVRKAGDAELAEADDDALLDRLWRDDDIYARYNRFHEREAFQVMLDYIAELRAYADAINPDFAISANVAYLGNMVRSSGPLWGCLWGPHVAFVLMENDYRVRAHGPHELLPRGTFSPWYRLGASFKGTPTWICPSINVPRQLAGEDHRRYYELMFVEAFAHHGRWGYYWWPGVDERTRREATAPEPIRDWIRFINDHRDLYERTESLNDLAVLYLDGPIMRRPETHERYVALAQALAELGYQFDVVYCGDGDFNPDELDPDVLQRYRALLIPEARDLGHAPAAAIEAYARAGGAVIAFSEGPLDPTLVRAEDGQILADFWIHYRDEDRERIATAVEGFEFSRIRTSQASVQVVRYALGEDHQVLHLLNYAYDAASDMVAPARDLEVRLPWAGGGASCRQVMPDGESALSCRVERGELVLEVPELDLYALAVATPVPA